MRNDKHARLFIPGPVEVRPEILDAQADWMIGHRSRAFADLFARLQPLLRRTFYTDSRVYISTSSGSGLWEAASRNCVRDESKVLHLVNGAFSERWAAVSKANGKQVEVIEVPWGKAVKPEQVRDTLRQGNFDALALVYSETSTGVLNPLREIAQVVDEFPETLLLVDVVSAYMGTKIEVDAWGIDVCLTSTQKALALPPGMALGAVSDAVLARAEQVPFRGYYFDFLTLEKYLGRNNTPATPPISLMYALEKQLHYIFEEGMEARFARHAELAGMVQAWALERGFELFAEEGYRSPTVTAIANTREIDVDALNAFLTERGMVISNGYGKLKGQTFRIAHMGDVSRDEVQTLLDTIDEFLETAG
jgi:predicted phosphoserine aminotransferase